MNTVTRLAAMASVLLLAVGCTQTPDQASTDTSIPTELITATPKPTEPPPPPNYAESGPGTLVQVSPITDLQADLTELGATTVRIVYKSTSGITDQPTLLSGVVVVPAGAAPEGGWPVVAFGHGTTGVLNNCGPSRYANLLGNAPILAALVLNGFAVAMTDYQGLGLEGNYHPYLDSKTFGYNMIDAVRAARNFDSTLSSRWAAYGVSLGGMAAWAASDRAATYGQGLDLVGTAALVPVSDMAGLADEAAAGTLTRAQYPLLMYALQALSWSHPEMNLDDYRFGLAREKWDLFMECVGPNIDQVGPALAQLTPADLRPANPEAVDRLRGYLQAMALPQNKSIAPMLVMYGSEDDLILQPWTEKALNAACAQGDVIQYQLRQGEGHGDLDSSASLPWVKARFAGQKPLDSCPEKK